MGIAVLGVGADSALNDVARELGGDLGIAVLGSVLQSRISLNKCGTDAKKKVEIDVIRSH